MTFKMISHDLTGHDTVEIYGISDLHVGSKEFDEGSFIKLRREILEQDNRYVIMAGDLVDNAIKSSVSDIYQSTMRPKEQREYAAELLYPLRSRILVSVGGNHERRSTKETDTDPAELIMSKLGLEHLYRDNIAFVKVKAGSRTNHCVRPPNYSICVLHGSGGGMLLGSALSRADGFLHSLGCDMLVMGHVHKQMTAPTARYEVDMSKEVVVRRESRIMICTGWLNWGGYPAQKMLKPVSIRPSKAILATDHHDIAVLS